MKSFGLQNAFVDEAKTTRARQNWSARLALLAIGGYQRHVSPRKGFRCAYSVLNGGTGCSGFVDEAIRAHGLRAAIPLVRERFGDCKLAAQSLGGDANNRRKGKSKRRDGCDCDCLPDANCGRCGDALFDCGPNDSGCFDCGSCH